MALSPKTLSHCNLFNGSTSYLIHTILSILFGPSEQWAFIANINLGSISMDVNKNVVHFHFLDDKWIENWFCMADKSNELNMCWINKYNYFVVSILFASMFGFEILISNPLNVELWKEMYQPNRLVHYFAKRSISFLCVYIFIWPNAKVNLLSRSLE